MKGSKIICALSLLLALLCFFCSCKEEKKAEKVDIAAFSLSELEEFVKIGEYKNISISLNGKSKEEAINDYLVKNSKIEKLPEGAVEYYNAQLEEQYKYHAEQAEREYKELLEELSLSESALLEQAKSLVIKDIIFTTIQKKEGIALSSSDKERFFDRYVEKYAELYGYEKAYVKEKLVDEVYQTMLYDKTMEFLILNNTFN